MIKRFLLIFFSWCFFSQSMAEEYFKPLEEKEFSAEWTKEYLVGKAFLKEQNYPFALYAFKKAEVLLTNRSHLIEIQYYILLTHFRAHQYEQVLDLSRKVSIDREDLPKEAYENLLVMLHNAALKLEQPKDAHYWLTRLKESSQEKSRVLELKTALSNQSIDQLSYIAHIDSKYSFLGPLSKQLEQGLKSPRVAKWLSILLPGAGYYYVGQKKSAVTSFLFNGLLLAASWQFFAARMYALGILTLTFESGWYFGGILGSMKAATVYNQYQFDQLETKISIEHPFMGEEMFYEN